MHLWWLLSSALSCCCWYAFGATDYDVLSSSVAQRMHEKMDADGDGVVSKEEMFAFAKDTRRAIVKKDNAKAFDDFDKDRNGKVDVPEFLQVLFGSGLMNEDVDGSEVRDEDEADFKGKKMDEMQEMKIHEVAKFSAADHDKDGFLNQDELLSALYPEIHDGVVEAVATFTVKKKDMNGDGELTRDEFSKNDGSKIMNDLGLHNFASADADSNGRLSMQEVMTFYSGSHHISKSLDHLFSHADEDSDSFLSKEELDGAREPLANTDITYEMLSWAEHHEL